MTVPEEEEKLPRTRLDHVAAYVLARVCADARPAALRDALRTVDPLERGRVRLTVQRALDDAQAVAPTADRAHVQRLAYLDLAGVYMPLDAMRDEAAVRARFERSGFGQHKAPRWWTTILSTAFVVVTALLTTAYVLLAPAPFEGLHPREGGRRDAYRAGGVPVHDAAVEVIFADHLPGFVAAQSRLRFRGAAHQEEADEAAQRFGRSDVREALPSDVLAKLQALVRAYAGFARGAGDVNGVVIATQALDAALARAGLGYFVDALHTGAGEVALGSFGVDRVGLYETPGGKRERVLFVHRLDHLNVRQTALAYTRHDRDVSLVVVDSADNYLVDVLLPLLAEEHPLTLVDARATLERRPWLAPVHESAEALVRRELVSGETDPLLEIAEKLERRRVLHYQLMERTMRAGFALAAPDRYDFPHEGLDTIEPAPSERGELERLRDTLAERDNVRAFVRARETVEETIAWHAVQYRIDARRRLTAPAPLVTLLDPDGTSPPGAFDGHDAAHQLSAYLAAIGRDADTAGLALTLAMRLLLHTGSPRNAELAAWTLVPELARTLRVGDGKAPIELRESDVTALYVALARLPGARLSDGARKTWARLYGAHFPSARRIR